MTANTSDGPSAEELAEWPDCIINGCPNKVCTWGSNTRCYPHEYNEVGPVEMNKRFDATHEHPYDSDVSPNYMTRTYAQFILGGQL